MLAADVASLSYPVVKPEESLAETLHYFMQEGMRYLPVVDDDNMLLGVLDRQEIQRLLKDQILSRTAGTEYLGASPWRKAVESDK